MNYLLLFKNSNKFQNRLLAHISVIITHSSDPSFCIREGLKDFHMNRGWSFTGTQISMRVLPIFTRYSRYEMENFRFTYVYKLCDYFHTLDRVSQPYLWLLLEALHIDFKFFQLENLKNSITHNSIALLSSWLRFSIWSRNITVAIEN